ncbi:YozE family protein [Pedobacter sp. V48]|uniref:YozE family protein n=1 Tax=Pedobacter sp. V48 TaxID=509635 RepID=UPI0003E52919|nr:YozE family protein [Pedobacter sp. V48]ETZ19139.1 hypothetical protein N824_10375 [Pedobacter sp. V48]
MTLLEFIKSHALEDSSFGDLADDVMGDKNFPYDQGEERIASYLEFMLHRHGNVGMFEEFMEAYQSHKDVEVEFNDLDTKYAPMRAERWEFLKANFSCDKVISVGEPGDIYRIYAIDSAGKEAIKFDVYGKRTLTELSVVEIENIVRGNLTRELSVAEALAALAENKFEGTRSPTQPNYSEMIDYLTSHRKDKN